MGAGPSGVTRQEGQDLELLCREVDRLAPQMGLVVDEVEFERPDGDGGGRRTRSDAGIPWRMAVRIRASSSAMPNGFVT